MNQKSIQMKPVGPPTESPAAQDHELTDQFLQDNDYLPVQGDQSWREQSWREQAALRIGAGRDENDETETPDTILTRADRLAESEFHRRGNRGGLLIAFLSIAILIPAVVALTAPGVLTADFWRTQRGSETPIRISKPAPPPLRAASIPAPARETRPPTAAVVQAPKPQPPANVPSDKEAPPSLADTAQAPNARSTAIAPPTQATPPPPTDTAQDLNTQSSATMPDQAAPPKPRPITRTAKHETGATGGFGSFVLGPDGRLQYRFFPTESSGTTTEPQPVGSDAHNKGPGFYTMVADPDGTLRYKYFPSKPER